MPFIKQVLAVDVEISTLYNPAPKIPITSNISTLLTEGGFNVINLVFTFIGLALFANFIMAGWDYVLSSGDPKKVSAASGRLTNGFIGVIMAISAFLLVRLVTTLLGLGGASTPTI